MYLRSFATRLLIAMSILFAVAFAGDSNSFTFYLSSNRSYAPNDPETSIEFNGNDVGRATVMLRAFKVDDPVEFFLSQKDPHSPTLQKPAQANTFDMLRLG